jgi:hypothetical protein
MTKKIISYTSYQIKMEKPNWNQISPIKIEGQTTQWTTSGAETANSSRASEYTAGFI